MKKRFKAQSAMEYLMTYGWAILIIAVVLAALFALGVFTNPGLGTSCLATPGYLCSGVTLSQTSASAVNLSFTFGETGATIYNIGLACSATTATGGLPQPTVNALEALGTMNTIVYITSNGFASANGLGGGPVTVISPLTLISGAQVTVKGLTCYNANADAAGHVGLPLTVTSAPIGSSFTGGIYMNYTTSASAPTAAGGANPLYTVKVATFTAKIV